MNEMNNCERNDNNYALKTTTTTTTTTTTIADMITFMCVML
jgi:hypothetical protein